MESLLIGAGLLSVWAVTLFATAYMAVFHLPLSMLQSVVLLFTAPTKLELRSVRGGLLMWFVVMVANQCLAFIWLIGYVFVKNWAYSTSFGDVVSGIFFAPSAVVSTLLIYRFRPQLYELLS